MILYMDLENEMFKVYKISVYNKYLVQYDKIRMIMKYDSNNNPYFDVSGVCNNINLFLQDKQAQGIIEFCKLLEP